MSDLISRQSVINAIANTCFWLSADDWNELIECINSIPPAENKADFPQAKDIEPTVKNFSKVLDNKLIRDATAEERCCFCGGVKRFGICQDCGSDM